MSIESVVQAGRRLVTSSLLDRCTVRRRTLVADTLGGHTETYAAVASAVACRFGSVVDQDPTTSVGVIQGPRTTVVLMGLGQDVRVGDVLVNESSTKEWKVTGFKTADSALATGQRILVVEV